MGSKQKVIAQALGIAQGTVSKVLKRNRETGEPTHPELNPDVLVRQQKGKTVICYVYAEIGVPSQQKPFVLSGYGSQYPCILNASEPAIDLCILLRQETCCKDIGRRVWIGLETISAGDQVIGSMSSSAMNPDSCFTGQMIVSGPTDSNMRPIMNITSYL